MSDFSLSIGRNWRYQAAFGLLGMRYLRLLQKDFFYLVATSQLKGRLTIVDTQ
jgi:hypothetical protein